MMPRGNRAGSRMPPASPASRIKPSYRSLRQGCDRCAPAILILDFGTYLAQRQALLALTAEFLDPDPSWWEQIPLVTAPVLLLAGGPASSTPQERLAEAVALLPDGRVAEIPVGHHIHQQAPERFLAAVSPFLAS
jgi:pimeloyl-ACP methyl ester carboxylesterase